MPEISFIVTTYNIESYIQKCLTSLSMVVRPGDQVILIDDGSTDATEIIIREFSKDTGFIGGVEVNYIFLGANTFGGVGIAGNIGLREASRNTVFFVDGDDWLDGDAFREARSYWALHEVDIMFTNYKEYDQKNDTYKKPSDSPRWSNIDRGASLEDLCQAALSFIAVPWRKFYRRELLIENGIFFPEGAFFFEDNPFHWDVCLHANSIGFFDKVTCYHRINRPGQTMTSTGVELAAFFVHFDTILEKIEESRVDLKASLSRWLLANMTWQIGRISEPALYIYFSQASKALRKIDSTVWEEDLAPTECSKNIWVTANRLRDGDIWGVIDQWKLDRIRSSMIELRRISMDTLNLTRENKSMLQGANAASLFESIARQKRN
ncbi:glycosyltransferase family 2 protein [Thioclava sp.]|uniref:glycosyltransferase family 2 protein n=1 Tax=Thioclava sp. TaxID=1933450 RepID=UPI003AA7C4CD